MAEKKPIERTISLSIPLDKAAKIMGIKVEYDPWDDFYYGGYSKKDIKNMNLRIPSDLEGVEELFPTAVLSALEGAERNGLASEAQRISLGAIEDAFEKISAPMEYTGENSDGEEQSVSVDAAVKSARVDTNKWVLDLKIENPEHLINGLIAGVGSVYPDLPVDVAASDEDIVSRIGWLKDFFEVFGERIPEPNLDRVAGDFDDEFFAEEIKAQLDMINLDQAADDLEDYMDDADEDVKAKDVAAKMSKLLGGNPSAKEILDAYAKNLDMKHLKKKSKLESKDDDDLVMCSKCKEWTSKKDPCCPGGAVDLPDEDDSEEIKESEDDFITIFLKKDKISKDPRALMKMAAQLEKALNRDVAISGEGSLNIYTKDQALIKKAVELIGDDVVDKEELDVVDYDIVRNAKRDQKKVMESKELLEWSYSFKDKAEQIKQLAAFIGDMKASRIENDLAGDSLDDIFSHGRDEVEDQLTGLAGKVNGKDTQDVFKELSAGLSDKEINQAAKAHDLIINDGWTNYSKSDYQDYAEKHGIKLESKKIMADKQKKSGQVLWFNESIGRGSIADKDGCVYEIDTVVSGEAKIKSGQAVVFEEVNGPRTRFASKIKVIGG